MAKILVLLVIAGLILYAFYVVYLINFSPTAIRTQKRRSLITKQIDQLNSSNIDSLFGSPDRVRYEAEDYDSIYYFITTPLDSGPIIVLFQDGKIEGIDAGN